AVPTRTGVPAVRSTGDIYFNLMLPAGPRPANGWPVAIFGNGFADNKDQSPVLISAALARAGIATIAINAVGHGSGAGSYLAVIKNTGPVLLPAGGRGVDQNGDTVIDPSEGVYAVGSHSDLQWHDGLQ